MAGTHGNDAPRGRASTSLDQPQRNTRSWVSHDGTHYTLDSTTYVTPGLSFGAFSGTANGPFTFDSFMSPSRASARTAPCGLLGNALDLLEGAIAMHPQHTARRPGWGPEMRRVHVNTDGYDADLAFGRESSNLAPNHRARRRSIFSRLKDRIVDVRHHHREDSSSSRERSSGEETRAHSHRASTLPREARQPAWETTRERTPDFIEVDYQDDTASEPEPEYIHRRSSFRGHPHSNLADNMIDALEDAVDISRQNVRGSKQKLAHASRQANVSSSYLQRIVDEIKQHEATLASATSDLNEAKARHTRAQRPGLPPRQHSHSRPGIPPRQESYERPPRSQPRHSQSARDMHDHFFDPFSGLQHDPIFQAFQNLHGIHAETAMHFDPFFGQTGPYFVAPGRAFHAEAPTNTQQKRTRHSAGGPQPSFQHSRSTSGANFARPVRAPQPPATMLRPDEAKRLFVTYNERWNALPPSSPDIPFPARGLHAGGLVARDSIWAPNVDAHVASWTEETVMQANAQAFYLGVVGLSPSYVQNPASGRVEVGFDRARASPAQIQQLIGILKKEKTRWHSDRLGRRNQGKPGPNEALQKDERARAVFHAVCELMERTQ